MSSSGKKRAKKKDSPDSSQILYKGTAGGVSYEFYGNGSTQSKDYHAKSTLSYTDGPERTTSTTEGRIGGGETSETRALPSSTNTSEEQQVDKSAENAFTAPVQVPEDLRDSKDLSLNDIESSLALGLSNAKDEDKLNVTLVTNDEGWKITVTDQLLTELAKDPSVKLSGLVEKTNPELEAWAKKLNIKLVLPLEMAGFEGKDTLSFPPDDLDIDVLIIHSYGSDLGRQAQVITKNKKCRWVQVVHTVSQELAKYGEKKIHDHDHEVQLELCKRADMIIAIGPKVAGAYHRHLKFKRKEVFDFTPGINDDLINARSVVDDEEGFWIMVSATYYEEFFEAKGLDIAAEAINLLQDISYQILFLVKPNEDAGKLESRLNTYLDKKQFTVERLKKNTENFKTLLCRVQLAILPSRGEGFGTSILPALSADVPVLVGGNTGLGMAVKKLSRGKEYVIDSDDPEVWAKKIKEVKEKGTGRCSEDAKKLREEYMKKYSKTKQCHTLVEKMLEMFPDKQGRLRNSAEHVEDVNTISALEQVDRIKCRLNMKVTEIPLEVYPQVCVKLNVKREVRFDDFRMLAEKVGLTKAETALIENYSNPTDEILKIWSAKNEATVGNLIELLKEPSFDRQDVVQILQDWVNEV